MPDPVVPVSTPVEASIPTPTPVAPVTAPTEAVQAPVTVVAPPVEAKVEAPQTVLAEALDKQPIPPEVKTEVKAPEAVTESSETKVEEGEKTEAQSAEPAPAPVYEPFKAPEGVSLDQERIGKFTELLADLELKGKADHALVQEFGQKAVDFHVTEVQKATEALTDLYKQSWERQKIEWKDSFLKDPEIGGNRFQTTVDSALGFIRTHGGTPEQQTEFRNLMETSGLGNHPAVIRLLANAGRAMSEGKQLAATTPVSAPKSKTATLYGKSA